MTNLYLIQEILTNEIVEVDFLRRKAGISIGEIITWQLIMNNPGRSQRSMILIIIIISHFTDLQ